MSVPRPAPTDSPSPGRDVEQINYRPFLNRDRTVSIFEEDDRVRDLLMTLFRLEGFITRMEDTGADILERVGSDVDVLLANFDGYGGDAPEIVRELRRLHKGTVVVALINRECVSRAVDLMRAGAYDVLVKPIDTERLLSSVKDALRRDVQLGVSRTGERSVVVRGFKSLTEREREVLQSIVEGRSNKATAMELGISPRTVEVHRSHVMRKLGAANTADLLRIVLTA